MKFFVNKKINKFITIIIIATIFIILLLCFNLKNKLRNKQHVIIDNNVNNTEYNRIKKIYNKLINENQTLKIKLDELEKKHNELIKEKKVINNKLQESISKNSALEIKNNELEIEKSELFNKNMSEVMQFLIEKGFKKNKNETNHDFILRDIKSTYNELTELKKNYSERTININKLEKSIKTLFSILEINGIIIGDNIEDIIINSNKLDDILKKSVFIIYNNNQSKNKKILSEQGVIEIRKANNELTFKIIKGEIKEGDFF